MAKETWQSRKRTYEALTLQEDGDLLEQIAVFQHQIEERFPNYQKFWQFVICPSSERPVNNVGFRSGTAKEIKRISQVSYSILQNLIQADGFAYKIHHFDFGFLDLNIQQCLIFSGNALQLLHELKIMVEERLPKVLGVSKIVIFPDKNEYKTPKDNLSRYRNYLTHSGLIMKYPCPESPALPAILRSELLTSFGENPTIWDYMDMNCSVSPNDLIPLHKAVLETNEKTWAFIDLCYGKFLNALETFFEADEMQKAWGWEP